MFNLTNLILSLLAPVAFGIGLALPLWYLMPELLVKIAMLIYVEHVCIGKIFRFNMRREASGAWVDIPSNTPLFIATLIFDYLIVVALIYVWLTFLTKR